MKNTKSILKFLFCAISAFSISSVACAGAIANKIPNEISDIEAYNLKSNSYISFVNDTNEIPVSAKTNTTKKTVKLFGLIPVKDVSVNVGQEKIVTVCGYPFGCVINTKNVLVVGSSDVETSQGLVNPSQDAGIKVGDYIISINGCDINETKDITKIVNESNGKTLNVKIFRNSKQIDLTVTPALSKVDNKYKIGLWVRDSEAGVGMLSFYSEETGICAGLGHTLTDADTGASFYMTDGIAFNAQVLSIKKGAQGNPGQIFGSINTNREIGEIVLNNETGVYIKTNKAQGFACRLAHKESVVEGAATLFVALEGDNVEYYDIKIEDIDYNANDNKNMVIKITDEDLIAKTGGIVQGMSGSPILQNGKLVGVVTHVLVNDSTKGYAVFAETMMQTAESVAEEQLREAS